VPFSLDVTLEYVIVVDSLDEGTTSFAINLKFMSIVYSWDKGKFPIVTLGGFSKLLMVGFTYLFCFIYTFPFLLLTLLLGFFFFNYALQPWLLCHCVKEKCPIVTRGRLR